MIDSVDRIVQTPVRECPPFVEAAFTAVGSSIVKTFWFSVEPHPVLADVFIISDESGQTIQVSGSVVVQWLKPEDMNDPVIQAELITGLASMGVEL
jgi:hypothetical protein